jgi:hypothetical protein
MPCLATELLVSEDYSLDAALAVAQPGGEISVAAGTCDGPVLDIEVRYGAVSIHGNTFVDTRDVTGTNGNISEAPIFC